jgi:hypothetical protein
MTLEQMEAIATDLQHRVAVLEDDLGGDAIAVPNNYFINNRSIVENTLEGDYIQVGLGERNLAVNFTEAMPLELIRGKGELAIVGITHEEIEIAKSGIYLIAAKCRVQGSVATALDPRVWPENNKTETATLTGWFDRNPTKTNYTEAHVPFVGGAGIAHLATGDKITFWCGLMEGEAGSKAIFGLGESHGFLMQLTNP